MKYTKLLLLTIIILVFSACGSLRDNTASTANKNSAKVLSTPYEADENEKQIVAKFSGYEEMMLKGNGAPNTMLPCIADFMNNFPKWIDKKSGREQLISREHSSSIRWTALELYGRYLTDELRKGDYNPKVEKDGIEFKTICAKSGSDPHVLDLEGIQLPKDNKAAIEEIRNIRKQIEDISDEIPDTLATEKELTEWSTR